jgi:predicted DNA-binding transcriptional regulator YafY
MEGVTMTDVDMTPGVEKEIENLPTRKRQLFAMYGGEVATVEVQVDKDLIGVIFDKFGDRVQLQEVDERWLKFTAEVQVSPTFIAWCCSFGAKLKVIAPTSVVGQVKDCLEEMIKIY